MDAILIYGNTASGKSTVARMIAPLLNATYISFGELLRSNESLENVQRAIQNKLPFDTDLCSRVIRSSVQHSQAIVSGFPISQSELASFSKWFNPKLYIHLLVSDEVAKERFFSRLRDVDTEAYFFKRMSLYHKRIVPFIESLVHLPGLVVDTNNKTPAEILDETLSILGCVCAPIFFIKLPIDTGTNQVLL